MAWDFAWDDPALRSRVHDCLLFRERRELYIVDLCWTASLDRLINGSNEAL